MIAHDVTISHNFLGGTPDKHLENMSENVYLYQSGGKYMVIREFHEQIRQAPARRILDGDYAKRPALKQKYQKSLRLYARIVP